MFELTDRIMSATFSALDHRAENKLRAAEIARNNEQPAESALQPYFRALDPIQQRIEVNHYLRSNPDMVSVVLLDWLNFPAFAAAYFQQDYCEMGRLADEAFKQGCEDLIDEAREA